MQDKDIIKTTLNQVLTPIIFTKIIEIISEVDRYVKKLTTIKLLKLLIFAQLNQYKALRMISNSLHDDNLKKEIELESIIHSQTTHRLRELPTSITYSLFTEVNKQVGLKVGYKNLRKVSDKRNIVLFTHLVRRRNIQFILNRFNH